MADGTPIGALAVRIGADASDLITELRKADTALGKTASKFGEGVASAGKFAAAAAAAGAMVFALTKRVADNADELGKLSQKVGVTVESLSGLAYAARLNNLSLDGLGTGMRTLAKNMLDAQSGTGDAKDAFKALRVEVEDAPGKLKPTDEMLLQLADKFSTMQDGAGKTAIAMRIFGKSGTDLIPLLNQGRAGIEELRKEAERLGIIISKDAAKAAEEFNDNLTRMKASSEGLTIQLAGPLVTALRDATGAMRQAKAAGAGFFEVWKTGIQSLLTGDDVIKWSKDMAAATDRLLRAEQAAARGPSNAFGANKAAMQRRLDDELAAARADVERLQKIKPIIAPDQEPKPEAPKKAAPALPNDEQLRKDEQRRREIIEATRKAGEERDKIELDQIRHRNEEIAAGEETAFKQRIEQMEEQQDREVELGQAKLERLRIIKSFEQKTDEELENEAFEKRMQQLKVFTDIELENIGGRQKVIEQMEIDHQSRLFEIRSRGLRTISEFSKASWGQQTKTMIGMLADMTAGAAQHNKKMFEINKVAGIANAIVKGWEAVQSSYAFGASWGGPIAGAAMAALAAAATLVNVQAIRNASFGGGGGAPSIAGSTPAPAVTPVDSGSGGRRGPDTIIQLHGGDLFTGKQIRELVDKLNEGGENGARIILAGS